MDEHDSLPVAEAISVALEGFDLHFLVPDG
jgi:hypothetical protein